MTDEDTSKHSGNMDQPTEKFSDGEQYAGLRDRPIDSSSVEIGIVEEQVFSMSEIDPVLDAKMRLVNQV